MVRTCLPDPFTILSWILGGVIILISGLALLVIAVPELADVPHLITVVLDTRVIESLALTFAAGCSAVLFLLLFGTPLAYALSRTTSRWRGVAESLLDLPLALPHTVAGLMVYLLFMSRGLIGGPLAQAGIFFEDAFLGIVMAMIFVSSPYYVNTVREGFERVPVHLESVARTLGATEFAAFRQVALPLCSRHIWSGALLAWGRAVGEFAAVIMIAYFPEVISALMYQRFSTGGIAESRSIAFIMIVVCLVVFFALRSITRTRGVNDDRT
jgi:molybdate/tungstate transport system permease protein